MPRHQDGFKPMNSVIEKAFTRLVGPGFKNDRARCQYCHKEADYNVTRLQAHLDNFKAYRDGKPPEDDLTGSQQTLMSLVAAMP